MDETNEFSFALKPANHGIGVFARHAIRKGARLRLFADDNPVRILNREDVPTDLLGWCASKGEKLICPPDFGYMPVGWYLNHSNNPNAVHDGAEPDGKYGWWTAARDISAGEEITINYNELEEPEEDKDSYYQKSP